MPEDSGLINLDGQLGGDREVNKVVSKLLLVPLAATLALLVGIANPPAAVEAQAPEVYISTPVPSMLFE